MHVCLRTYCNRFFSFSALLGPLGLIIVWHSPKKCGNAAMPRSGKNTGRPTSPAYFNSDSRPDLALTSQIPKKPRGGSFEANNNLRDLSSYLHIFGKPISNFIFLPLRTTFKIICLFLGSFKVQENVFSFRYSFQSSKTNWQQLRGIFAPAFLQCFLGE